MRVSRYCCLAALVVSAPAQNIRVLFLGGGNTSHDPLAMSEVMIPVMESHGMTVDYKTNESILDADSLKRYDVMFIYNAKKGSATDGTPDLTTAQVDALYAWVDSGHVVIGVHCANSSYLGNPRYLQLFGGAFTVHGDTAAYHYITIVDPAHPSMQGVSAPPAANDAGYWDEGRVAAFSQNDTIMLARARAYGAEEPWTWVRPEGKGWVYYTSSGHDARSWDDANFQNQLVQALTWGAGMAATPIEIPTTARKGKSLSAWMSAQIQGAGSHSLRITSLSGATVFSQTFSSAPSTLWPALPAGVYSLQIDGKNQQAFKSVYVK